MRLSIQHSAFSIQHSAFSIQHSAFNIKKISARPSFDSRALMVIGGVQA